MRQCFTPVALACLVYPLVSTPEELGDDTPRRIWSHFSCAIYASFSEKTEESEIHFNKGYTIGVEYMTKVRSGEIEFSKHDVPIGLKLVLQGPTPDFMIGRVYAVVEKAVWDQIHEDLGAAPDDSIVSLKATMKYTSSNCQLLI